MIKIDYKYYKISITKKKTCGSQDQDLIIVSIMEEKL